MSHIETVSIFTNFVEIRVGTGRQIRVMHVNLIRSGCGIQKQTETAVAHMEKGKWYPKLSEVIW